jgi:signal transduction histidine kinase
VIGGVLVLVAGAVFAWTSLGPLRGLGARLRDVAQGRADRIVGRYPSEVQPLVDRVNTLLEDRETAIARAYAAAGDLAHALKTPLALLAREADRARDAGQAALADAIDLQIRRMTSQVDRHLARARVAAVNPLDVDRCELAPCLAALARTVSTLYAERHLSLAVDAAPDLFVRVRQEDLEEILGNVLDNACKWATAAIQIRASATGRTLALSIEDDGPGLPASQRTAVLERGVRLDEAAPGSGLGLAIVRDLAEHYGGTIVLDAAQSGGLSVRITLPAAEARGG